MQIQQITAGDSMTPNPQIEYEQCPNCSRNFFKGKLQFHLKLCSPSNPMHISPKKTPKRTYSKLEQSKQHLFSNQEMKCQICNTKLPAFLFDKHAKKCNRLQIGQEPALEDKRKNNSTEIGFKQREEISLPAIKKIEKEPFQTKKFNSKEVYMVRLRDELRCLRKAEEINEIECSSCGRFFSKAASLRHTPICQQIKLKEKYDSLLKRRKKTPRASLLEEERSKSCEKRKKAQSCMEVKVQEFKLVDK